jgi:hypothetical protein
MFMHIHIYIYMLFRKFGPTNYLGTCLLKLLGIKRSLWGKYSSHLIVDPEASTWYLVKMNSLIGVEGRQK